MEKRDRRGKNTVLSTEPEWLGREVYRSELKDMLRIPNLLMLSLLPLSFISVLMLDWMGAFTAPWPRSQFQVVFISILIWTMWLLGLYEYKYELPRQQIAVHQFGLAGKLFQRPKQMGTFKRLRTVEARTQLGYGQISRIIYDSNGVFIVDAEGSCYCCRSLKVPEFIAAVRQINPAKVEAGKVPWEA